MLKPGMKARWHTWMPQDPEYSGVIITSIDNNTVYCIDPDGKNQIFYHPEQIGTDGWIILEYPLAKNIKGRVRGYGSRKDIL